MFGIAKVSPSIIATNYQDKEVLKQTLQRLEESVASMIHLDVMDGKFVKNSTFDESLVEYVKDNTTLLLDVHLMVKNPEEVIDKYIEVGADIISVHYESTDYDNLVSVLQKIKSHNIITAVAINPSTPVSVIQPLVQQRLIDMVTIMSVEPGEYGQPFIVGSAEKVAEARALDDRIEIEVDGGVTLKNAMMLRKMGATILVSGATVFSSKNINKTIKALKGSDFLKKFFGIFKK